MKKYFLILSIAFFGIVNAQSPNYLWAKSSLGNGSDKAYSVSSDANGNVYVAGSFSSSTLTLGSIILTNMGYSDMFLAKYDAAGNVLWAKSAGGSESDFAFSVSTDDSGNIYVVGGFNSYSLILGSDTLNNISYMDDYPDIFLAKYDAAGNVLWAKRAGGIGVESVHSVKNDANGNIYMTGYFTSDILSFGAVTLSNSDNIFNSNDMFLAKYDASGNILWAKNAAGNYDDFAYSVSADANGNIYVLGNFNSPTLTFGTIILTNMGYGDMYLAKYDTAGNIIWAKSAGGSNIEYATSVSTDANGNVYVLGSFLSPNITFDSITLNNTTTNSFDMYLTKYDSGGNILWAKNPIGSSDDIGKSVSIDSFGNIYVAGSFYSPTLTFSSVILSNVGNSDLFLASYDMTGNVLWAQSAGGIDHDFPECISVDAIGTIYLAGGFTSPTLSFGSFTLNNNGNNAIFITKLEGIIGIDELIHEKNISIYPTPFSVQTTLQTDKFFKNATLTVYNSFGQTVKQIKNINGQTVILLRDNLASGLYFVRLTEDNKTIATDKLVIADN